MENDPYLSINEKRNFPFKYSNNLPIIDALIKRPKSVTSLYVSSIQVDYIYISAVLSDNSILLYAKSPNAVGTSYVIRDGYVKGERLGTLTLSSIAQSYTKYTEKDTALLDSVLPIDSNGGVSSAYVLKKSGELLKLSDKFFIETGSNIVIETGDSIKISAITIPTFDRYLRRLVIDDPNNPATPLVISGKSLTLIGRNIVLISATNFDTSIVSPELSCPVVFDATLKGDKGDSGPVGSEGFPGAGNIIDCGTKDFCDPCDKDCGEFDMICDLPPFPGLQFPPLPLIPDVEVPQGCPIDIGFPKIANPKTGGGGGVGCDIFDFAKLDLYPVEDIGAIFDPAIPSVPGKFIKGIFSSGYPDALAGPLGEDYAYVVVMQGKMYDDATHAVFSLPIGSYALKFTNIEFEDVLTHDISQVELYFYHGFRHSPVPGAIAFNAPSSWANNVFKYCVDGDCKRVFFYETIKESFTGEWDHGHYGSHIIGPEAAAMTQTNNKNLYALYEDGTKYKVINVKSTRNITAPNLPCITLYNLDTKKAYLNMPMYSSPYFEEDVPKTSSIRGPSDPIIAKLIYSNSHPLAPLGLSCISNTAVDRTPSQYFDGTTYSFPNITGCFAWTRGGANRKSYFYPYNRRRSWYKNVNLGNCIIKAYSGVPDAPKATYLNAITEYDTSPVLSNLDQGMGSPPRIEANPILYKYYDYEGTDRISDAVGLYLFSEEIFTNTDGDSINVQRIHMLAVNNHNLDDASIPNDVYEFDLKWTPEAELWWYPFYWGTKQAILYEIFTDDVDNHYGLASGYVYGKSLTLKDYYANENNFVLRLYNGDGTESYEETRTRKDFHVLEQSQQIQPYPALVLLNNNPPTPVGDNNWLEIYHRIPVSGEDLDQWWTANSPNVKEEVLMPNLWRTEIEMLSPSLVTPIQMLPDHRPAIFKPSEVAEVIGYGSQYAKVSLNYNSTYFEKGTHGVFARIQVQHEWEFNTFSSNVAPPVYLPDIWSGSGDHITTYGEYVDVTDSDLRLTESWSNIAEWTFLFTYHDILSSVPSGGIGRWYIVSRDFPAGGWAFIGPTTKLSPAGVYTLYRVVTRRYDVNSTTSTTSLEIQPYALTVDVNGMISEGFDVIRVVGTFLTDEDITWNQPGVIGASYASIASNADTYAIEGNIYVAAPMASHGFTVYDIPVKYNWTLIGTGRLGNGYKSIYGKYDNNGYMSVQGDPDKASYMINFPFRSSDLIVLTGPPLTSGNLYSFSPLTYTEKVTASNAKTYTREWVCANVPYPSFISPGYRLDMNSGHGIGNP